MNSKIQNESQKLNNHKAKKNNQTIRPFSYTAFKNYEVLNKKKRKRN